MVTNFYVSEINEQGIESAKKLVSIRIDDTERPKMELPSKMLSYVSW